jgi:hypothetical protein
MAGTFLGHAESLHRVRLLDTTEVNTGMPALRSPRFGMGAYGRHARVLAVFEIAPNALRRARHNVLGVAAYP